jgi:hypothetical protein
MLASLYLICHIDRANIGNAKIEGMVDDLGMTGVQYNIVLSICEFVLGPPASTVQSLWCHLADTSDDSFHTLRSFRDSQQYSAQEIQAPLDIPWHPRPLLGSCDDIHGLGSELRWFDGHPRTARYFRVSPTDTLLICHADIG